MSNNTLIFNTVYDFHSHNGYNVVEKDFVHTCRVHLVSESVRLALHSFDRFSIPNLFDVLALVGGLCIGLE